MKLLRSIALKILLCLVCVLVFASVTPANAASAKKNEFKKKASQIVKDMGTGWNLGNSLENKVTGENEILNEKRGAYKVILNCTSNPYSAWDASQHEKISETTGSVDFDWKIDTLKSNSAYAVKSFGIQIFNYAIGDTGSNTLKIEVKDAKITLANGIVYKLNSLNGNFELTMKDGVAKLYPGNFDGLSDLTIGDLMGATVHISVTIKKYLQPVTMTTQATFTETKLSNPVTTKALIKTIADAGFESIRVPVTYSGHMDKDGNIDKEWLDRIEEIVKYCIDNDLYVIINIHHDGHASGWLKADSKTDFELFEKIWKQVSNRFMNYGEKLIFEGYNEVLDGKGSWTYPGMSAGQYINKLAQIFVDTVRASGGNNAKRYLMISTYGAMASEATLRDFVIPQDIIADHLIVDIHAYLNAEFCWYQSDLDWTTECSNWGSTDDVKYLDEIFSRINRFSKEKNVPVVIGEFGCWDKDNTTERSVYLQNYMKEAKENNIACFWWDTGCSQFTYNQYKASALIDRKNNTILFPELVEIIARG